ncbi:hypothetical protein B0T21DRAFT_406942 [Apiosordaria backusii]|uniref:Secreted protein n=1 Tax=Apiosordaria backusii TaxID=314023 RepID=A0AA40K728_9PEZI|nr:hypothetical protein B0T21DRAFT_406942 [Apiosordaria backusii]
MRTTSSPSPLSLPLAALLLKDFPTTAQQCGSLADGFDAPVKYLTASTCCGNGRRRTNTDVEGNTTDEEKSSRRELGERWLRWLR